MASTEIPADAPEPRLCQLIKWPDFDGYGFNLHAEKSKPGQFIGKVDEGSPAEAAGMKRGDRIVEVNGVNIANENHKQVVERVKAVLNETRLLVVDDATDKWYKERKLVVKGTQPNVKVLKTPNVRPGSKVQEEEKEEETVTTNPTVNGGSSSPPRSPEKVHPKVEVEISEVEQQKESPPISKKSSGNNSNASTPSTGRKEDTSSIHSEDREKVKDSPKENHVSAKVKSSPKETHSPVIEPPVKEAAKQREELNATPSPKAAPKDLPSQEERPKSATGSSHSGHSSSSLNGSLSGTPPTTPTAMNGGGRDKLNLNMTAQEMRALLATRKKYDPKKESMDLRQKYNIIQDM